GGIRDRNVTGVQTCALPISCKTGWIWPKSSVPNQSILTTAILLNRLSTRSKATVWTAVLTLLVIRPLRAPEKNNPQLFSTNWSIQYATPVGWVLWGCIYHLIGEHPMNTLPKASDYAGSDGSLKDVKPWALDRQTPNSTPINSAT